MNHSRRFVRLDKTLHDRTSFDCGEKELNDYLRQFAARHMEAGISTTMVLPSTKRSDNEKQTICAWYSVSPGSIERKTLPPDHMKKLPHYPVPVFLIGQMAVHSEYQGTGIEKITLVKALEYLWKVNHILKAYAVIVDCLNESVEPFYLKYGFREMGYNNKKKRLFLPMKTLDSLFG